MQLFISIKPFSNRSSFHWSFQHISTPLYEDYLEYQKNIYDNYCRSYGVSEEVGKITDNIKNSSANRYEAVKKLEYYLSEMEYSTKNVALPDTVTDASSFLDYFLLSSRKGYCMHYATAFVLMANEMGIPCRYV